MYRSLAERLDKLRETQFESAADSLEYLKELLELAKKVVEADRSAQETDGEDRDTAGATSGETPGGLLPDARKGALTQIFEEYGPETTPEIIERVVEEIDAVVGAIDFGRWAQGREKDREVKRAIRQALNKYGLPVTGPVFDKAYDYVAEHY